MHYCQIVINSRFQTAVEKAVADVSDPGEHQKPG